MSEGIHTVQSRHFHTKFASPRLPGISCCSCNFKLNQYDSREPNKKWRTHEAIEAHPVRVYLMA